jgi:hypothetical protein
MIMFRVVQTFRQHRYFQQSFEGAARVIVRLSFSPLINQQATAVFLSLKFHVIDARSHFFSLILLPQSSFKATRK